MSCATFIVFSLLLIVNNLQTLTAREAGCNVKEPENDINWTEMPPNWYLTIHTPDVVFSDVVACQVVDNTTNPEPHGFRLYIKNYYISGAEPRRFTFHAERRKGSMMYHGAGEEGAIEADSEVSSTHFNLKAVIEATKTGMGGEELTVISDQSTYMILVLCDAEEDIKVVLVYTSTPNPDAKVVLDVVNELYKIDSLSALEFTKCGEINFGK